MSLITMAKEEEEKNGQAARRVERREHVGTGKHRPPQHLQGTSVWLTRPGPHSPWKENEQGLLVPQRRTQMRFLLPLKDIGGPLYPVCLAYRLPLTPTIPFPLLPPATPQRLWIFLTAYLLTSISLIFSPINNRSIKFISFLYRLCHADFLNLDPQQMISPPSKITRPEAHSPSPTHIITVLHSEQRYPHKAHPATWCKNPGCTF